MGWKSWAEAHGKDELNMDAHGQERRHTLGLETNKGLEEGRGQADWNRVFWRD